MIQSYGRRRDYHGVCVVAWPSLKSIFANHARNWRKADIPFALPNVYFGSRAEMASDHLPMLI